MGAFWGKELSMPHTADLSTSSSLASATCHSQIMVGATSSRFPQRRPLKASHYITQEGVNEAPSPMSLPDS